jgi:hypothetical protein
MCASEQLGQQMQEIPEVDIDKSGSTTGPCKWMKLWKPQTAGLHTGKD